MKHFVDIQRLREFDEDVGGGIMRRSNAGAFHIGDHIQITEKIDGANCSVRYNTETQQLDAFSRKTELNYSNTNRGFWNFSQTLDASKFAKYPNYIFFGEWLVRHSIAYDSEKYNHWYVYDVYDAQWENYLPQTTVKDLCDELGLEYVHVLYDGKFQGWDHVRTFLHAPGYGDSQEGVVVKRQGLLNSDDVESPANPSYIKIVNQEFTETKAHTPKEVDQQKEVARATAQEVMSQVVTEARVRKEIHKMVDEGLLPEEITPQDMKTIAQHLPKRIYDDCVKEEPEIVASAGELGGKVCNSIAMALAKKIILG